MFLHYFRCDGAVDMSQDDQYESLEIPYTSIRKFSLDRAGEGQIRATLDLSMAPRLGKDLIKLEDRDIDRGLNATFLLSTGDANRLTQALDSRGLVCMPSSSVSRLRLTHTSARSCFLYTRAAAYQVIVSSPACQPRD